MNSALEPPGSATNTVATPGVVIMDNSLEKVDEFLHISRRMRRIALESALGAMALGVVQRRGF